jgi:hypothetical protein
MLNHTFRLLMIGIVASSCARYAIAQSDLFPVTPSTIALWRFNNVTDSTISDVSGHGYNGVVSGNAPLVDGQYGKAISCNGQNQFLTINNWTGLPNSELIEIKVLFKPVSSSDLSEIITDHHWYPTRGFVLRLAGTKVQFAVGTTNGWHYLTDINSISFNVWHQVRARIDCINHTVSIQKDDEQEIVQTFLGDYLPSTLGLLRIAACSPPPPSRFLNAVIDEIIISGSTTDKQDASFFPLTDNTIALWRFNANDQGYIKDVSSNGNNAAISGEATLVTSPYGNAISFNGVDQFLTVDRWSGIPEYSTVEIKALIKPVQNSEIAEIITDHHGDPVKGFVLQLSGHRVQIAVGTTAGLYVLTDSSDISYNEWHRITAKINRMNNTVLLQKDVEPAIIGTYSGMYTPSTLGLLRIAACSQPPPSRFLNAFIDEIVMYGIKTEQPNTGNEIKSTGAEKREKITVISKGGSGNGLNIGITIKKAGTVSVAVFTFTGIKIAAIADKEVSIGKYTFQWACCDKSGKKVAPGAYLLRCRVDGSKYDRVIQLGF